MEHLVSDIKNIMTSLCQMTNYIFNKKVDKDKVNDWDNLKGIGKETWHFISVFYDVGWDALIADSNGSSFRNKVAAKFMPIINTSNTSKGNNSKSADQSALTSYLLWFLQSHLRRSMKFPNISKNQSIKRKDEVIYLSNYFFFNQQH